MKSRKVNLKSTAIIICLFVFQQSASKIGSLVAGIFNYNSIDEYGLFAKISVHHIVQMLLALLVIVILSKIYNINFGFRSGNVKIGVKNTLIFTACILTTAIVAGFLNSPSQYSYPLNIKNVFGSLGFQLFLSGPSEEILFRALPITVIVLLAKSVREYKIFMWNISCATILSALFFSLAHIKWTVNPFTISMDIFQLIYCFVLGIMYGYTYEKSGSVLYPMIMHSISNVIVVGFGFLSALVK